MAAPIDRFDARAYVEPRPQPWLIHALAPVARFGILAGLMKLRRIELPAADLARLRAAENKSTSAFLGPNHPEFTTDWMLDKHVSTQVSPLMAHWASYEIVNASPLAQRFWLANNLIANAPGGDGRGYSVRWALRGHGVLLHPEGTATWQAERVGALLPGLIEMAAESAAAAPQRATFAVPVIWKLRFTGDAGDALAREISLIERELRLPASSGALEARFAALHGGLLAHQCERWKLPAPQCDPRAPGREYFAAQSATIAAIRTRLEQRYGTLDSELTRAQHQLRKAFRERAAQEPDAVKLDRRLLAELQRLTGCEAALYDKPTLTQEQMAERLKHIRSAVVTRGTRNALHNLFPVAVAPRDVAIRVPEPIAVPASAAGDTAECAALLALLRQRMQATLDELLAAQEGVVAPYRRANLLRSRD
jgi:hypothetical protein